MFEQAFAGVAVKVARSLQVIVILTSNIIAKHILNKALDTDN